MADVRTAKATLLTDYADNTSGDISANDGRNVIVSCHPETVHQSDTQANEPSSGQLTGDLFLPNNGFQIARYSGSAWLPWGPLFPFTKPIDGDFAWVNQGSASVSTTNGGIHLTGTGSAGESLRIRKKSAPSTPYTITAAILPLLTSGDFPQCGVCFRQASDGKLVTFCVTTASGVMKLYAQKWTNATSYSADYTSATFQQWMGALWLRISDDGTNRKCWFSTDGQNWVQFHTVGRTDFLTADEVGFFANGSNVGAAMTLLSWKEA